MIQKFIKYIIPIIAMIALMTSCVSGKIVLSNDANISKYKYVIFGKETSGDRELDDVVMSVQNQIAETNLIVLSASNTVKIIEYSDSILTPNIHVTSEKWDGGHTYITVTFYDYNTNQSVAVIKSSGIGMTVSHDQNIALSAIRKNLISCSGSTKFSQQKNRNMYPNDNIFNIYYNIGKRTPFLVKRCELGLARASSEERRIDPNQDRTFLVETVKPRGKYGKAYGKCFVDGKPDDTYRQECYPDIKDEEIPCAGCGEWVLIDVPGVSLDEIFPIHKAKDILMFGKYKGKSFGEIYKLDYQYLHWLETTDRFFKIDFEELRRLYPNVENSSVISITEKIIDFGKYKGKKFSDIINDTSYLEWLVSIEKLSIEEFRLLTTNKYNLE